MIGCRVQDPACVLGNEMSNFPIGHSKHTKKNGKKSRQKLLIGQSIDDSTTNRMKSSE